MSVLSGGAGAPEDGQRLQGKLLTELSPHECRWPILDAPDGQEYLTRFCACCSVKHQDGRQSPYCVEHYVAAYEMCGSPDTYFDIINDWRMPAWDVGEPLTLDDIEDVIAIPEEDE